MGGSNDEVPIHPAANLLPLMSEKEFEALVADIALNGLNRKLIFYQRQLLDGRNRLRALQRLGIDFRAYCEHLPDHVNPYAYVVSENIARRHLSKGQLAIIAAELVSTFACEAKQRSRANLLRGQQSTEAVVRPKGEKSRDIAARICGVSGRLVSSAQCLLSSGRQDLIDEVRNGSRTLSAAVKELSTKPDPVDPPMPNAEDRPSQPAGSNSWSSQSSDGSLADATKFLSLAQSDGIKEVQKAIYARQRELERALHDETWDHLLTDQQLVTVIRDRRKSWKEAAAAFAKRNRLNNGKPWTVHALKKLHAAAVAKQR